MSGPTVTDRGLTLHLTREDLARSREFEPEMVTHHAEGIHQGHRRVLADIAARWRAEHQDALFAHTLGFLGFLLLAIALGALWRGAVLAG